MYLESSRQFVLARNDSPDPRTCIKVCHLQRIPTQTTEGEDDAMGNPIKTMANRGTRSVHIGLRQQVIPHHS